MPDGLDSPVPLAFLLLPIDCPIGLSTDSAVQVVLRLLPTVDSYRPVLIDDVLSKLQARTVAVAVPQHVTVSPRPVLPIVWPFGHCFGVALFQNPADFEAAQVRVHAAHDLFPPWFWLYGLLQAVQKVQLQCPHVSSSTLAGQFRFEDAILPKDDAK